MTFNSFSFDTSTLPIPRVLSYNIRSLSFYSTFPHALSRRLSIANALNSFCKNHEIICLQETHLASEEQFALSNFQDCSVSRNNKNILQGGTAILDTPLLTKYYNGTDITLPPVTKGFAQLRRYTPTSPSHSAFQLFNVYFRSGDDHFNKFLIQAMLTASNDIPTFLCGDLNFIERAEDSSSASPHIPSQDFLSTWSSFKSHFKLFDPPHDAHTFFHITDDPSSPYTWSSRIDRFLLPLTLYNHPLLTPTVSIPHHHTNLSATLPKNPSTFSDHLPIHLLYDNGIATKKDHKTIPTWLASTKEFADSLRILWSPQHSGGSYKVYDQFKATLFKAAAVTRAKHLASNSSALLFSQHLSLLRLIHPPLQDLSRIHDILSRNPALSSLITFKDNRWHDNGLLAALKDLQLSSSFSTPPSTHPIKALANDAPSTRARIGSLRDKLEDVEAISDDERSRVAASYWSKIWAARPNPPPFSHMKAYLSNYKKKVNTSLCPSLSEDDILDAIKHSSDSSPGPDGISFAAWRAAPDLAAPVLYNVFRALSSGQPPPPGFNQGLLFLLPKKSTGLISDTRPISVTNTDNRILAAAVAKQIMPAVLDIVEPSQKGFLSGRQGADHILDINAFFYEGVEKFLDRFLFLLDTAKAFDSIDHNWIHTVLEHVGFPRWLRFFIRGCLQNVRVAPFFGQSVSTWIDIDRGVKQGCPLSPLLFILCFDPLLYFLKHLPDINCYAFADDLAVTSSSIPSIFPVLSCINTFSVVSGLGINKDKSFVLSTSPPSRDVVHKAQLKSSPWPDLSLRDKGTHLGIVLGREVTLKDIWEVPLTRALARINRTKSFVKSLPLAKRILYVNVFIVSIFSYVGLFFILPTGIWKTIRNAIARMIIPFNGGAFTYESLVCSNSLYNISPPLKDVWAFNISLLASRSPFISYTHNYFDLPRINVRTSKLIRAHRDAAAIDFWRGRHLSDGSLLPLSKTTSPQIYKCIIQDVYLDQVVMHDSIKICKLLSSPLSRSPPPLDTFYNIVNNLRSHSFPAFLIFHHYKLLHNALPTSRRLRHMTHTDVDQVSKCFFCGIGQDSIIHIYSNCSIINKARILFLKRFSLNTSIFTPLPSFSAPSPSPTCFSRPHLFPSLVRFLSSLSPASPPAPPSSVLVTGEVPLGPSLLLNVPDDLVLPILCFNLAVWDFRRPARAARVSQDDDWLCARLLDSASSIFSSVLPKCSKKRSSKPKTIIRNAIHDSIASSYNPDIILCYTDGSASPNPGPCGAAASIFINDPDVVIDVGVPLGHNTNNVAEIVALVICLSELIHIFSYHFFSKVAIFSDSKYAIGIANGRSKVTTNVALATLLRSTIATARDLFTVELYWVKGHSDFGGNIRVDTLSKLFASLNHSSAPVDPLNCINAYSSRAFTWKHSFPLAEVPTVCFSSSSNASEIRTWSTNRGRHKALLSSSSPSHPTANANLSDLTLRSLEEPLDFKHSD